MPRVLVTGGAGFIGSHLVDRLLASGAHVIALDNLVTGGEKNVAHLKKESRFELVRHDLSRSMPDVGPVEAIFHFASPASPKDFVPLALEILKVGSKGTFHTLEYAERHKAWVLLASTSEVYGDPLVHPQPESYLGNVNPIGIRGVYDESKRFSEAVTMAYRRAKKVSTSIIRIFNTYGPRMRRDDGRAVPNFILQALGGMPVTVYGDGSQTRSLCYVADLVEGIYRMFEVRPAEPVNLGNDREMTMKEIAEKIIALVGSKSRLTFEPLPEGDPKQRCPDLSRARKILGWTSKTPMEEGLKATIDFFRSAR